MTAGESDPRPREANDEAPPAHAIAALLSSPARRTTLVLSLIAIAFLVYAFNAVPRLTNNLLSDSEFTGWSGPIAERIAGGERPYVDFVLPIPPGSFVILAAIERISGRAILMHELWVAAISHLLMSLLAYVMVRPFTSRENSLWVSLATLVTVIVLPKECAYDHTGQVVAWASIAAAAHALTSPSGSRRSRLFIASGLLATFAGAFKQSTSMGAIVGLGAAFGFLLALELWEKDGKALRARARELGLWSIGAAFGVLGLVLLLFALGSHLGSYWQAVFVDGPELKGGNRRLLMNLVNYLVRFDSYPASLALSLVAAAVLVRMIRRRGLAAEPPAKDDCPSLATIAILGATVIVCFGTASVLLAAGVKQLWAPFHFWADRLRLAPGFGLLFLTIFAAAWLVRPARGGSLAPPEGARFGHALLAVALAALVTSLLHNLSFPGFRPFYDNNPIIPIAFLFLLLALDRAELPRLKVAVFALSLLPLYGVKLERALEAQINVGSRSHWAGMRVNERGHEVIRAALRARALAAADETVLVLPEDMQLAALIDRPRPAIRGAVVFVDQYPERLAAADLATLEQALPKVVVIHPSDRTLWRQMFEIWMYEGGAYHIMQRFLDDLLPKHYRLDSSFRTRFARKRAELQVWVRKEPR